MIPCTDSLRLFLTAVLGLLTVLIVACLVRTVLGPRYTDRVVALNLILTLVILLICLLSYLLDAAFLLDVAMLYALLNLLSVALLSRISIARHRGRKGEKG